MTYETPKTVSIEVNRWNVKIIIEDALGGKHTFRASADSQYTGGSNIWWGTEEEYKEDGNR